MKKNVQKLIGLLSLALYFLACDDEELKHPDPIAALTAVEFTFDSDAVKENTGEKTITLALSKQALHEGSVKIAFDTTLAKHFTTSPTSQNGSLILGIKKGENTVSLKVTPKDNTVADGNKIVVLTLKETSDKYQTGLKKAFTLTIQDDETPTPVKDSYVNFIPLNATIKESNTEWHDINVHVSESQTVNGSIEFQAQSGTATYGVHYITQPAFTNGKLTLQAVPGTSVITIKVLTLNNDFISGNVDIDFAIVETSGNIKKGVTISELFKITDDELEGKPKGYETSGGGWGMKKTYEYNSKGDIARVLWENYTPNVSTGMHTYYYNDTDQLIRINTDPGHDITYHWENGKITKQEKVRDGVVRSYSEYGYDDHGNVGSYRTFYLQPNGTFSLSDLTLLLYYLDGNLYKKIVYYPKANSAEELEVVSETTFDSYLDADNPFPMVEVLPNMKTQKKLPSTYRHQAHGHDLLYNLSYEFRPDGKVGKRTAIKGTTTDVAVYHYY